MRGFWMGLACGMAAIAQTAPHSDCDFFGPARERYAAQAQRQTRAGETTARVAKFLSHTGPRAVADHAEASRTRAANLIDQHIFARLDREGVAAAPPSTDFEFIRRVTLDLTGRIPAPEAVLAFAESRSENKRAELVEQLLAGPQWVDKWTLYFGDRFKNSTRKVQVTLYPEGRNAFHRWIRDSLAASKPYDRMAREIIAAKGTNSHDPAQGPINWIVGGVVTGGPQQDVWDQQAANVAETFLGIAHLNCLLCHNGAGHLDELSAWATNTRRIEAQGLASFFSHSVTVRKPVEGAANSYSWEIQDETRFRTDYALNTNRGNRPPRRAFGVTRTVAPRYPFTGEGPREGEPYRDALARLVTADFQFARAAVNYLWKEFFGRGLVEPVNQFDPARLDPANPPPAPWTLQPSHPELLNALAQDFVDSGYDLKHLMRLIATSEAYGLSSRYEGEWNPEWEPLFARKLVRRLWGEELLDAIAQASGVPMQWNVTGYGPVPRAMETPEPLALNSALLNSFFPGNRDDQERREDGSVQQALALMNDNYVLSRTRASNPDGLLAKALAAGDDALIDRLFLTVLSRPASDAERSAARAALSSGNRQRKAEDLLWSLFNKVDFIFNY